MTAAEQSRGPREPAGLHVATIAHGGLLWDVYLQSAEDPPEPAGFRGRIRFDRPGPGGAGVSAQTAIIIIEDSYEEAVAKVRRMDERQLAGLLRSALPDSDAS